MKSGYKQTQVGVIPEKWKIGGPGTGNTFSLHRKPPRLHQSQGTDQPSHEQRQSSTRDAGCPPVLEFHSNQRLPR